MGGGAMSAVHSMSIGVINSTETANTHLGADNVSMRYLSGSLIPNERRIPVLHNEDSSVESSINWPLPWDT